MGTCENGRWKTQKTTFETGTRVLQSVLPEKNKVGNVGAKKHQASQNWKPLSLGFLYNY